MSQYQIIFAKKAETDLDQIIRNPRIKRRVNKLMDSIALDPRSGIGKPERLKHYEEEVWSRRIDSKNRIEYRITGDKIEIASLLGHYE